MKILITIIIYNRYYNLEAWLRYWKQCETGDAELVVIHNDNGESAKFKQLCDANNIRYIRRNNIGFDIGAFQDVCLERLPDFPDYDYLLWITDDTIPMVKDFITPFISKLQDPSVGIACMQISKSSPGNIVHVRTTGFAIRKETASRLKFQHDQIKTKQDCYYFEHRGAKNTLCEQVRSMGLSVSQVATDKTSPLWDTGYWKRLDRQAEHDMVFNPEKKTGDKVTFICTVFNTYPQIISSLLLQTHKNWELILIHDGPSSNGMRSYIPDDDRIKYIESDTRYGNWGHYHRQWALEEIRKGNLPDCDYVVVTNADNYYTPEFIRYSLHHIRLKHTTVATYPAQIVHSYTAFKVMDCRFQRGFIDSGCVMIKKDIACEVGWRDIESHSSDWTFFSDIAAKYSPSNFVKIPGCLFVHN